MRAPMLAFPFIVALTAAASTAQTVIDVEGQKVHEPLAQEEAPPQTTAPQQPKLQDQPAAKASESQQEQGADVRYSFSRVDNGFLRLDSANGQVAFCRSQTTGWSCEAVPENRASLESEISQLQGEVASLRKLKIDVDRVQSEIDSLKKQIADLKEPAPPRPPADLSPSKERSDMTIKLPTHEDIARARDFMASTWRRLVEMISAIQRDVMQRG